jgi:hypothetical protein
MRTKWECRPLESAQVSVSVDPRWVMTQANFSAGPATLALNVFFAVANLGRRGMGDGACKGHGSERGWMLGSEDQLMDSI